jgi:ribonuclease HI
MSIRVGKYNYKTKVQSSTPEYQNVLIHTTGDLSPYTMKDKDGVIMENYWQFSKVWEKVESIKQPLSQYDQKRIRWEHPSETHLDDKELTKQYWKWRKKGFSSDIWVRYPNGYKHHSKAKGSVIGDKHKYKIVGYIEARKKIYFPKYCEIARKTKQFKKLKEILNNGGNIQINEVDGPSVDVDYPYCLTENGSIEINEKILRALIKNPKQAFGHGYALAACLLDIDLSVTPRKTSPQKVTRIPGLHYCQKFLDQKDQNKLLKFLKDSEWEDGPGNRKVLQYGYIYPYSRELKLEKTKPIPSIFQDLIISKFKGVLKGYKPDQAIVNRYLSKQGIGKHIDHKKLFKDKIVCITIGSGADMIFRNDGESVTVKTEPGSYYMMSGDARWKWTHEMPKRYLESPRYSITFRIVEQQYVVHPPLPKLERMTIWTDGACLGNGDLNASGGYGVYFEGKDEWNISKRYKLHKKDKKATNNNTEMYAVYSALKRIYYRDSIPKELYFRIDNKIALNTLLSNRKAGANWHIIEKLYVVRDILIERGYQITGEWVHGHSGVPGNEKADELASKGALKKKR